MTQTHSDQFVRDGFPEPDELEEFEGDDRVYRALRQLLGGPLSSHDRQPYNERGLSGGWLTQAHTRVRHLEGIDDDGVRHWDRDRRLVSLLNKLDVDDVEAALEGGPRKEAEAVYRGLYAIRE